MIVLYDYYDYHFSDYDDYSDYYYNDEYDDVIWKL